MTPAGFAPAAKPTLESVLDHAGIRYQQKQGGQKILCPVHDDRKPSCSLDLGKGLWNCQSCDAQGDAWTLLMLTEGIKFKDAVALADRLGLPRVDEPADAAGNGRRRTPAQRARSALVGDSAADPGTSGGVPYVPCWRRRRSG